MRFFEVAALAAWIINLTLAIFVLSQDVRSRLHRAYFAWGLGAALWNLGAFFLYQPVPGEAAIWWARLLQVGLIITPLGLYETSRLLSGRPAHPRLAVAFLTLHGVCIFSLGTRWFIRDLSPVRFGHWPLPGPLAGVFTASYVFLVLCAAVQLRQAARSGSALRRTRLRAVSGALALLVIAAVHDLLPTLGYDHYPLLDRPFYPLGSIISCFYMIVVAYSVLQHRLLNTQLALGRAAAHLVRFGFLALSSLCLLVAFTAAVPGRFNDVSFAGAILVQVLGAVVASVFFPRLFGQGPETVERRILGDQPEYTEEVRTFVQGMHWHGDLAELGAELHRLLTQTFRVGGYALHLRAVTGGFQLLRAHPEHWAETMPEITVQSPLVRYFEEGLEPFLTLPSARHGGWEVEEGAAARGQLAQSGAALCLALRVQQEPIGFLLLGPKGTAEPFTGVDLQLLTTLVNTLGLVVNQIRLKTQIRQAQEFELLGRMSSGLAHDLNNLLTPISTLLQLTAETGQADEELLPVARRNVAAIRDYIREGLFFSQHNRPNFQLTQLGEIVQRASEVARNSRPSPPAIETRTEGELWAELDPVMIQRLLANLITNAMDASPEGARVMVVTDQLARTEEGREWLRIRVVDEGSGIASEDLKRVFTPYFTTKNRGDRRRGFGLGLAICRKIAVLHGGELSLESERGHGTTVAFDLPTRQLHSA